MKKVNFALNMLSAKHAVCNLGEVWEDNDCQINDEVIKFYHFLIDKISHLSNSQIIGLYKEFDYLTEIESQIKSITLV